MFSNTIVTQPSSWPSLRISAIRIIGSPTALVSSSQFSGRTSPGAKSMMFARASTPRSLSPNLGPFWLVRFLYEGIVSQIRSSIKNPLLDKISDAFLSFDIALIKASSLSSMPALSLFRKEMSEPMASSRPPRQKSILIPLSKRWRRKYFSLEDKSLLSLEKISLRQLIAAPAELPKSSRERKPHSFLDGPSFFLPGIFFERSFCSCMIRS